MSYPGYVLIEAAFVGQIPIIIRNTPNVLGFLGDTKEESRKMIATPLRPQEVSRILGRVDELSEMEEENEVPFFVGETVKVTDGPFSSFQRYHRGSRQRTQETDGLREDFRSQDSYGVELYTSRKRIINQGKLWQKRSLHLSNCRLKVVLPILHPQWVLRWVPRESISWTSVNSSMHVPRTRQGKVLPVIITVYSDKSFDFVVKQPPVAIQLKEAAKVKSGSAQPNRDKVGEVTWEQIEAIARDKMPDLNCFTVEAAMRMVAGTARSMGINVKGEFPKK